MYNTTTNLCFGCGQDNPIGLKLEFQEVGTKYLTYFTPGPNHQSYDGITHGGLICTVLDETMGRFLVSKGIVAFTAEMQVRFKNKAPIGTRLTVESEFTREKGPMIEMKAVVSFDDTIVAEAIGKFIKK